MGFTAAQRKQRRSPEKPTNPELDLFTPLVERLADALAALPPDAWRDTSGMTGATAVATLAERLATIRREQTEEC